MTVKLTLHGSCWVTWAKLSIDYEMSKLIASFPVDDESTSSISILIEKDQFDSIILRTAIEVKAASVLPWQQLISIPTY